jgi:hypothetical protein
MPAGLAGFEVGLQPGSRLSREEVLKVVLNAPSRDVGLFAPPRLPRIQPSMRPPPNGLRKLGFLEDFLEKGGPRTEFRKARKIGEEKTPAFRLTLAVGANVKMLPHHRFLPGSQLLVQELLDLLGGQMPHITVQCHLDELLLVCRCPLRRVTF